MLLYVPCFAKSVPLEKKNIIQYIEKNIRLSKYLLLSNNLININIPKSKLEITKKIPNIKNILYFL